MTFHSVSSTLHSHWFKNPEQQWTWIFHQLLVRGCLIPLKWLHMESHKLSRKTLFLSGQTHTYSVLCTYFHTLWHFIPTGKTGCLNETHKTQKPSHGKHSRSASIIPEVHEYLKILYLRCDRNKESREMQLSAQERFRAWEFVCVSDRERKRE